MPELRPRFWERFRLEELNEAEWEALCDGCGKCCLFKLEDEDTGAIFPTKVACRLLDTATGRCRDYPHRHALVPDCIQLTPALVPQMNWLPDSCAYRLVAEGKPLPSWHYLISGDREAVHRAGASVRGWTINEQDIDGELEDYILDDMIDALAGAPDDEPDGSPANQ